MLLVYGSIYEPPALDYHGTLSYSSVRGFIQYCLELWHHKLKSYRRDRAVDQNHRLAPGRNPLDEMMRGLGVIPPDSRDLPGRCKLRNHRARPSASTGRGFHRACVVWVRGRLGSLKSRGPGPGPGASASASFGCDIAFLWEVFMEGGSHTEQHGEAHETPGGHGGAAGVSFDHRASERGALLAKGCSQGSYRNTDSESGCWLCRRCVFFTSK